MEENNIPFITFEEKNPHKFLIELDHPNNIRLSNPHFETDKGINYTEELRHSNDFTPSLYKSSTSNTTNIFLINNFKENNLCENKCSGTSQNYIENNNYQNTSDEKVKNYNLKENENTDSNNEYNSGRWTNEEHQKFIEGILKYGNEWKKVQSIIKTRSSTQARSHAQKFFLRMKKEISPTILSDSNQLLEYIINTSNISSNNTNLTQEQKDRLFSVIRSNLKSDDNQNKVNNNQYNKEGGKGLDYIVEEDDNLAYNNENICNKKVNMNEIGEKRKITFCSKKRKNSSDYILNINDNKIFNIRKDMTHRKSMDITKSTDNFINKLSEQKRLEDKNRFNEINNFNNNIKNINNNINSNYINNDKFINKNCNFNSFTNYNNTNFIIQNNYYNIINNYNNNFNNNGINNSINNSQLPNYQNTYLSNDSINSDNNNNNHNNKYYNNIDNFKNKDKNNKNIATESLDLDNNIVNTKNPFDNYTFLNNENFFPNINKNNNNDNKNYDNNEQNDPFNLKFENVSAHNDNTILNDNAYLNNIKLGHEIDDYEFDRINFERSNNINDRTYDD